LLPSGRLTLLANGGFQLGKKALIVHQPLPGNTLLTLIDPLLLIIATVAFQFAEFALSLVQLLLATTQRQGRLTLITLSHIDDRRQTRRTADGHRLTCRPGRTEHLSEQAGTFVQPFTLQQPLTQITRHDRLASNG
jgi:hypothetical protein